MTYRTIQIRPLTGGALGAEISGVDLARPLPETAAQEIRRAFVEHQVVFFRDQDLTPDRQIAFSRCFGPTFAVPYVDPLPGHPQIIAVLKEADERSISTFGGVWHSDFSFLEQPPLATILYALDVPSSGGDTLWADMYRAYETLSPGLQRMLDRLAAIHTGAPYGVRHAPQGVGTSRSIGIRRGVAGADTEIAHPVVRTHPESGRRALFVNPIYTRRFEDMTEEESRPLLDFLYAHATRPEFTCRFRWTNGAVAVWDNRCTLHLAVNDYDGSRRLLHRTTTRGERPRS